jgi:hypothetical protein
VPTVLREGPYRFFFYASDREEPRHVHVERDERVAKFWLNPVRLQKRGGLRQLEIRRVTRIIEENQTYLMERWDECFDG